MSAELSCSYFWRHLCIRQGGEVVPCCRFVTDGKPTLKLNAQTSNFPDTLNGPLAKELRSQALAGKKSAGCFKCYAQEESGILSLRQKANSMYRPPKHAGTEVKSSEIQSLEVFVGDQCNLKCLMCDPASSSSWQSDYRKLGWFYEPKTIEHLDYVPLIEKLSGLEEIKFIGGEPLMSKKHDQILSSLSAERARKMTLNYSTNGTIWPKPEILEKWRNFKRIEFWLSIDGVEDLNDYIRFPSRWARIEANVRKFFEFAQDSGNFEILINCTVSVYNIFYLAQLENWFRSICKTYSVPVGIDLNPLVAPEFLAIGVLPESLKNIARRRLDPASKEQRGILKYLEGPGDLNLVKKFVDYTRSLDRLREQDARRLIPELSDLIIEWSE